MNVEAILRSKGRHVATIEPEATIADAATQLRRLGIGALVVSGWGMPIAGIVSERDIVSALAEHGAAVLSMQVAAIMTRNTITCRREDMVADLAALMTERRIRHLPVMDGGKLAGIVSIGDVVKQRIDDVVSEASSMRELIASA